MKRLFREIDRGLKSPVYIIYVEDPFLITQIINRLKDGLPEPEREIAITVYDFDSAERPSMKDLLQDLNTPGFLGKKKTVVLKWADRLKKTEKEDLLGYLGNPSPDVHLLIILRQLRKTEDLPGQFPTFHIHLNRGNLYSYIRDVASQKGLRLSEEMVKAIAIVSGGDAGLINNELEKLSLLEGTSSDKDSRKILKPHLLSQPSNVFSLAEAILRRDKQRAFQLLYMLSDYDPSQVVGALNWAFKESLKKGEHSQDFYRQAFQILLEADLNIKNTRKYPLEHLLFRLFLL